VLLTVLDSVVEAAGEHGLTPGIHAPSPTNAAAMAGRGFRFVSCAVDEDLLRGAAETSIRGTRGAQTRAARDTR
jgi:2-keto-3-deoxy-L-rhamnonate aldolase RhmA